LSVHAILNLLIHCPNATSKPEFTLAVLCDLSKAFDVINHAMFWEKLNKYGIFGIVNDWSNSYLSNRSQFEEVENIGFYQMWRSTGIHLWIFLVFYLRR
jgi:hypothetical protein